MKRRVLLTGSTGFIGQHLGAALSDYEVHALVRKEVAGANNHWVVDWQNETALQSRLNEIQPNFLIHLASYAEPGRSLDDFPAQIFNTILPAVQLARFIPKDNLELALFAGSCEEYGHNEVPFQETQVSKVLLPYGWGKISAKLAVDWICHSRELPYTWLRPFLTFGEGQQSSHFISAVIRACVYDEELELTAGEQTRDFVYVKDLVAMFLSILNNPQAAQGQCLNLCSGQARSIRSVAEKIQAIVANGKLKFGSLPYRENEVMSFYGDSSKFSAAYGFPKLTAFDDALLKTIQAFKK